MIVKVLLTMLAAVAAMLSIRQVPPIPASRCNPDSGRAASVEDFVRLLLTSRDTEWVLARKAFHVSNVDTSTVAIVRSDSLCRLAARIVNREYTRPDAASTLITMVSMGDNYWAEDSAGDGHWKRAFILDHAFSKVLAWPLH